MCLDLSVVPGTLANLSIVLFVKNLVICLWPVPSGLCWRCKQPGYGPMSVGRLGASLLLHPTLILFLFWMILFLVARMTGTCPLSPRTILIRLYLFQFCLFPLLPLMIFLERPHTKHTKRLAQPFKAICSCSVCLARIALPTGGPAIRLKNKKLT